MALGRPHMELKVDGRRVFAATGGRPFDRARPPVVFLHGAGCDHSVWQLPARWFAWHGFAALAVDLPGHGRSEGPPLTAVADLAQWAARVLDAAGVEEAALVGHSMGGAVALEAAAALGRRIGRLALLGTAASDPRDRRPAAGRAGGAAARLPDDDGVGAWRGRQARRQPGAGLVDDRRHPGVVCPQRGGRARRRSRRLQCLDIRFGGSAQGLGAGPGRDRRQRHHDPAQGRTAACQRTDRAAAQ